MEMNKTEIIMKNDLIGRDEVILLLRALRVDNIAVHGKLITEYIENLPTVYNVDKVLEQVHEKLRAYNIPSDAVDDVINRGGVEISLKPVLFNED